MQHRGTRLAILGLTLLVGALAGFFVWTTEEGVRRLDEQRDAKEATIDRILTSISTIASTQQAYAENRRRDLASFTRVSVLVNQITTDAAGLRAAAGSGTGSERLEEFWTALSALMAAESRAREQFSGGDDGDASETILASARDHVTQLNASLRAFRDSESASYRNARAAASWRSAAALVAVTALWAVVLVMLALVPRREEPHPRVELVATVEEAPGPVESATATVTPVPAIDLAAAALLTSDLSRLSDQNELPRLLSRAATIIDARGVVIWMGSGAELFAAAAHGYDESVLQRIKPIARSADNATAEAWRTSQLRTVPADAGGYGAIVAPMLNPAGCVGVLAAETRAGREQDDATQAVATIVASQLASVLAAWPAASTTTGDELDRKAAAS